MTLKTVLITGCSEGGIGSGLAQAFQKHKLRVFATARNLSKMAHLEKLSNVTLLTLDPTSGASTNAAVDQVKKETDGTLDYLVNNAGQTIIMPTLDFDIDAAKNMYDINVWGTIRVTQAFAPLLIAAKGTIVNNLLYLYKCQYALDGPCSEGVYAGSKAAVTAITDTLRLEVAPFGVKVVTVHTGAVNTNILTSTGTNFRLPPGSVYKGVEKEIAARAMGEDGTTRQAPAVYVENVVVDVLGGVNYPIWRGGYASIVKFTSSWFPASISDWMSIKGTGLNAWKDANH